MKRFLALLLAVLMVFALTACGGNGDNDPDKDKTDKKDDKTDKTESGELSFEKTVVMDNELLYFEISEIDPDGDWGYELKTHTENRSDDTNLSVYLSYASVNGISCDPAFSVETAPGKQANQSIDIWPEEFGGVNIGDYTDIELTFRVYDSENWFEDPLFEETIHIYPYGEDKASTFVREPLDSDTVILDNEYVTVVVLGYGIDEVWGYTVYFYFVNKTDSEAMFAVDNCSVNDCMIDPFYAHSVAPGKCSFSSMSFMETEFEDNNISEVKAIEFDFCVFNYENTDIEYFNDTVILNP